jgi:hypothetical protein
MLIPFFSLFPEEFMDQVKKHGEMIFEHLANPQAFCATPSYLKNEWLN